jgi:hypothetical protein
VVVGAVGLIVTHGYYRADAKQSITGSGNTTITVPGNNNAVTVVPRSESKLGSSADNPVADRKDCPAGTNIFLGGEMNFNREYGASIPKDAHVCFFGKMNGNGKGGLQIR